MLAGSLLTLKPPGYNRCFLGNPLLKDTSLQSLPLWSHSDLPVCFCASYPLLLRSFLLFSHSVVSDSLQPHGLHHTRLPCPSLSPGVCSNSCPLSQCFYLGISSSATPLSFCPQSFPASRPFPICSHHVAKVAFVEPGVFSSLWCLKIECLSLVIW